MGRRLSSETVYFLGALLCAMAGGNLPAMEWLSWLRGEREVLKHAPWAVVFVVVLCLSAGFGASAFLYERQLEEARQASASAQASRDLWRDRFEELRAGGKPAPASKASPAQVYRISWWRTSALIVGVLGPLFLAFLFVPLPKAARRDAKRTTPVLASPPPAPALDLGPRPMTDPRPSPPPPPLPPGTMTGANLDPDAKLSAVIAYIAGRSTWRYPGMSDQDLGLEVADKLANSRLHGWLRPEPDVALQPFRADKWRWMRLDVKAGLAHHKLEKRLYYDVTLNWDEVRGVWPEGNGRSDPSRPA